MTSDKKSCFYEKLIKMFMFMIMNEVSANGVNSKGQVCIAH